MKRNILFLAALFLALGAGSQLAAQPKTIEVQKRITLSGGGWLGVALEDAEKSGARVTDVVDDSPADSAGIKENDIIIKLNGAGIKTAEELVTEVKKLKPGMKVAIDLLRNGESKKVHAVLGKPSRSLRITSAQEMPAMARMEIPCLPGMGNTLGLKTIELRSQLGKYFGAPNNRGLLIEEVQKKSAAAKAGLLAGDVIIASGDESIQQRRDLSEAIDQLGESDSTISLTVLRKGTTLTFAVPVAKDCHPESFRNFHFNFRGLDGEFDFEKQMQKLAPHMKRLNIELQGDETDL